MIALRLLRLGLASAAIFSGSAFAVGLGEITLHSRIGETLRADIPLLAGGETIDAACFSVGAIPEADLPVVTAARIRLVRVGQDYRLVLTSSKPIAEPIALISVRAACGYDLKREYVLMPAPPPSAAQDVEAPTVASMPPPHRESARRRMAAERYANADNGDASERPDVRPRAPKPATNQVSKPKPPLPRETLAGMANGMDRVILGAAHDDVPPPRTGDPLAPVNELDERLLKMETTLHLLNQEVDKLNTAVTLAAESRAMREKLQGLQAQQATAPSALLPNAEAALPSAPARATSSAIDWLELLFGLLLGGSVSAGVAHMVSRRQSPSRPFDAPPPRIAKPRPTKA